MLYIEINPPAEQVDAVSRIFKDLGTLQWIDRERGGVVKFTYTTNDVRAFHEAALANGLTLKERDTG